MDRNHAPFQKRHSQPKRLATRGRAAGRGNPLVQDEARFLAGSRTRLSELCKVGRIALEFLHGFRNLRKIGPAVTLFGSARFPETHRYYPLAREAGAAIAREGFALITGGGQGLMEAASRGARENGGYNLGCSIVLPHEHTPNRFLDRVVTFYYFFVRKVMLVKYSCAFVILPGGMGTLDEMTEALTLIQTGKLYDFPVILMGTDYWKGLMEWLRGTVVPSGALDEDDLAYVTLTDDPNEVGRIIRETAQGMGLKLVRLRSSID